MAEYITGIRTDKGTKQIDYKYLANKPTASDIGAAPSEHRHTKSDISDFPTSLPANGGNADTLDNKHASDFALASNVETLVSDVKDSVEAIESGVETIQTNIGAIQTNIETIQKDIYESTFNLSSVTVTTNELNYVKGVTSNVQEQLDGKALSSHNHDAGNIISGTLPIARGGIGSNNGATGLKNLFAAGATVLTEGTSYQYGTDLPTAGTKGRIFFKKV